MPTRDKIGEAMRRSLPLLPGDARQLVLSMLQPASLAIIAATLVGWLAAHLFGVGEVVDLILLVAGGITLGFSVFTGAREMFDFAKSAVNARNDEDLTEASQHFAKAVVILGVSTVQALLLKGAAKSVIARGRPAIRSRIAVGEPPPAGNQLRVSRPDAVAGGSLGVTDEYGVIEISRDQSLSEQKITLLHELVHRFFSPRTGPLRALRAEINIAGYERSALLRYIEEALAEGYAQMKVNGVASGLKAYRFPVNGGSNAYVTVSQMAGEGRALGTITLGGTLFYVSISSGPIPRSK